MKDSSLYNKEISEKSNVPQGAVYKMEFRPVEILNNVASQFFSQEISQLVILWKIYRFVRRIKKRFVT